MLTPERKQEIILANARHEGDTGSPEVQIAVLTERIKYLTEHLKEHKKTIIPAVACSNGRSAPWFIKLSYG